MHHMTLHSVWSVFPNNSILIQELCFLWAAVGLLLIRKENTKALSCHLNSDLFQLFFHYLDKGGRGNFYRQTQAKSENCNYK